jgi:2-keto-4-pentenoate hydratase/2-oxohepta-3-ene-1,7-dioic acid hydratase in catechol pathway
LGYIKGDQVIDVTDALGAIPEARWPLPPGDRFIAHFKAVCAEVDRQQKGSFVQLVKSVKLLSPVANPTKVIGAPANYLKHVEEAKADAGINFGRASQTIDAYGLFLKNPTLVGPGEGVATQFADRRVDHEVELAIIIGKTAKRVPYDNALDYVAGYAIGLDMTVRGKEDRSQRKAMDGFSVLGPWIVTADEIKNPQKLAIELKVNGQTKQKFNTDDMAHKIPRCVEWVSSIHALEPGDILATGTNHRGLNAFHDGDTVELECEGCGTLRIKVRDDLKRTWSRETRLERQNKGFKDQQVLAPQLTGKYAPKVNA